MEHREQYSEFARKVIHGVKIAHKKMVHEKALKGENIVIADTNGEITIVPARDLIKKNKSQPLLYMFGLNKSKG